MLNIIVCGIGGKVGKNLIGLTNKSNEVKLICGIDKMANPKDFDIPVFSSFKDCDLKADVVIDFSRPEAIEDIIPYCIKNNCGLVVATTGHNEQQQRYIDQASSEISVFQTSNMSLGVNLLIDLSKQAASFLGNSYDIEIVEYHHNQKVDSPSGTALSIAKGINEVFENNKKLVFGRHSSNDKRSTDDIGIHSIRGGTIVGRHDVMYIGTDEIVTLSHQAESRQVFAMGALRAAKFIKDKKVGKYNMNDIIGSDYAVTVITSVQNISLFTIADISFLSFSKILNAIAENHINVDMISQTMNKNENVNISFTVESDYTDTVNNIINELKLNFTTRSNVSKLIIEGAGMEHQYGVAAEVIKLLNSIDTKVYAITTSETIIACCVDENKVIESENLLKSHYGVKI